MRTPIAQSAIRVRKSAGLPIWTYERSEYARQGEGHGWSESIPLSSTCKSPPKWRAFLLQVAGGEGESSRDERSECGVDKFAGSEFERRLKGDGPEGGVACRYTRILISRNATQLRAGCPE